MNMTNKLKNSYRTYNYQEFTQEEVDKIVRNIQIELRRKKLMRILNDK